MRDGLGASGAMQEARDRGLELVASVVAPSEAGEIAFGVIGSELAIGSGDRALDVSERSVDPLEGRHAGCLAARAGANRPVVMAGMAEGGPTGVSVGHDLGVGSPALWPRVISRLRKPLTGASLALRGRPSGPVATAATNGVLPCAPRPRLPPERASPR